MSRLRGREKGRGFSRTEGFLPDCILLCLVPHHEGMPRGPWGFDQEMVRFGSTNRRNTSAGGAFSKGLVELTRRRRAAWLSVEAK